MATVKQIALSLKRTENKIARLTKEVAGLKETKIKLSASLKSAKEASPVKSKKK
jgi:hypothetical protein